MQNSLAAVTVIPSTVGVPSTKLCRTHTPVNSTTTTKTPFVIQKSESFHVDSTTENNKFVIGGGGSSISSSSSSSSSNNSCSSEYPKLKRTASSDISRTIFNFNGNNNNNNNKNRTNEQPLLSKIKPKSDYSLTSRRKNSRNLYENYDSYSTEDTEEERKPLLTQEVQQHHQINVKKEENNVLVYTAKTGVKLQQQQQQKDTTATIKRTNGIKTETVTGGVAATHKSTSNWRHSWYAPVYGVLEEEGEQHGIKETASLHNLAGVKKSAINGTHESASLLDHNQYTTSSSTTTIVAGRVVPRTTTAVCIVPSGTTNEPSTASTAAAVASLGTAAPRKRKLEQFLKNLVSRRPSKESSAAAATATSPSLIHTSSASAIGSSDLLKSSNGGIYHGSTHKRSSTSSQENLTRSRLNGGSTASLTDSVHQKLWSVVPLLRKNGSCGSLHLHPPRYTTSTSGTAAAQTFSGIEYMGLRKCETVLALTTQHSVTSDSAAAAAAAGATNEPIRPLNRLRHCASIATCSRCSSLMSLAGAGSKYSLNVTGTSVGGFIPVSSHSGSCSSSSNTSQPLQRKLSVANVASSCIAIAATSDFTCKLCLGEFTSENLTKISQCGCSFCTECMTAYVEFEIAEGAYEVSCPDAMCPSQGVIGIAEINLLAAPSLVEKHHRYRLNREVELDKYRTWCPKAGCETICLVGPTTTPSPSTEKVVTFQPSSSSKIMGPCAVHCPTCLDDFCSGCKKPWHPTMTCEENTKHLAANGKIETLGIPFDSDLIKCCPMCGVPIEKDEGCAQMMCKRCKHVFCWYCLASLDDDFLLRHYDKGPCKNKLGHSRASVVWHRAQVIGIFAGFGILLLVASPLLLLAAPCIVCCKCRICSGTARLEDPDNDLDDGITLQR